MKKVFVPVRMVGVVTAEVSAPRNDGSPGSELYKIPTKIEPAAPDDDWRRLFVEAFDFPSIHDGLLRPGIARAYTERIILDGTTMEELESTHLATLKAAVAQANDKYTDLSAARRSMDEKKRQDAAKHVQAVEAAAKRIKFD